MSITKEEFDAAIASIKTAFVEALTPVVESVSLLAEAAKPAAVESEALSAVELAAKFNESGLPKLALDRVVEALKADAEKSVDDLIAGERAYVAAIGESVKPAADNSGSLLEAKASTTLVDEFDAIVSRHVSSKKG